METEKIKYLISYRWYLVVNYSFALAEQIALYYFDFMTFFWIALVLNVISVIGAAIRLDKLEKQLGFDF